ncbi:MAG: putative Ig domain-containing protein [Ardenticatenaceae bacterium]|nr:putative Ig domain-containing protein [Ardenticatenaceae bacterium]
MKKRFLSLVIILVLILVACGDETPDLDDVQATASAIATSAAATAEAVASSVGIGSTSEDSAVAPPPAGVVISKISGHTASVNAAAMFSVALESQPTSDVMIPISSSNPNEGEVEQSEIIFTPDNWFVPQTVVVRGTNANVANGEQNYQIILGSANSSDSRYAGFDPDDVTLRGIELAISEPQHLNGFVADFPVTIEPSVAYTGDNLLSFSLTESPQGMSIDLSTGAISWTPTEADEGQSYNVTVSVNDGRIFAETTFQVTIPAPIPINVEIEDNTLRVVDDSTSLNGMTITQLEGENKLAELDLGRLDMENVPETPEHINILSDVFVVKGSFDQEVELALPLNDLPDGASVDDIYLHAFTQAFDVDGYFWSPVLVDMRYEGTSDEPIIIVNLGGLEGLQFWGLSMSENNNVAYEGEQNKPLKIGKIAAAPLQDNHISCTQQLGPEPDKTPLDNYVCTGTHEINGTSTTSTFSITGWGPATKTVRWTGPNGTDAGITKEQLVQYLLDAQLWFAQNKLGFNTEVKIAIHQMEYAGYVTSGNNEKRGTLHLTDDDTSTTAWMKGTIVHEYFHHAQGHDATMISGDELIINSGAERKWIIEGTAEWFVDEAFDDLNSYSGGGVNIASVGINNATTNDGAHDPYLRSTFWKLVTTSCSGFKSGIRSLFNVPDGSLDSSEWNSETMAWDSIPGNDVSGIKNFLADLGTFSCKFGDHFGTNKSGSLEAALAFYNYATQFEDKMSLLDANEANYNPPNENGKRFDEPHLKFETFHTTIAEWTADAAPKYKLVGLENVPAAAAISFEIPAITGDLPDGKVAEIVVEAGQELLVSITSKSDQFVGTNTIGSHAHDWFSTKTATSYIFQTGKTVPEMFITLVNPSTDTNSTVTVYFQIREEVTEMVTIASHSTGANVSHRVETITGSISEGARANTTHVAVTVNGITSQVPVDANGNFTTQAILALGSNTIKFQGFNGDAVTTLENVLILNGVEASSEGLNALVASRVVFVLRWNTTGSDIDIYSTNKDDVTIWFSNQQPGFGYQDVDNTWGYGPEVVSYPAKDSSVYVDGTFKVDVHYYSGSPATHFTLNVILNEKDGENRREYEYHSINPLTISDTAQSNVNGSGDSRVNDIVTISCSSQQICTLSGFDTAVLSTEPVDSP